jgi:hypothetical protein
MGAAQQAEPPDTMRSPDMRISGKVVDAKSGQALARCVVEIRATAARDQSLSFVTGEDGAFSFKGLSRGKYQLTASRRGYIAQSYQQHEDFSTAIAVGPGLVSEGLIFRLTPQAILYGTVTDEAGEPIRGAQVRLFEDRDRYGVRSTQQKQTVVTDDLGKYELANLSPANYFLAVSAQPWYAHSVRPYVGDGLHADVQDYPLDVAYPTIYFPDATDSNDADPIPLRGGERLEANVTLVAQKAVRVRVPVPQGQLRNYGLALTQSIFGQSEPVPIGGQTNGDGYVEAEGVLPGHYNVTVLQYTGNSRPATFTANVTDGATDLIAETAADEVKVAGKVTGIDMKGPAGGISLFTRQPRRDYSATLSPAGEFTLSVPPGDYEVIGRIPRMYLASVSSPNAQVKGRMLQVRAGASPKLEIVAGSGFARIDGLVASQHRGVGGVMVLLAPVEAKENEILFRRDQSDSDGTFSLFGIIPGSYRLMAIEGGWDMAWSDPNVLAAFLKRSIPVQVHEGDKLQLTVEVQSR